MSYLKMSYGEFRQSEFYQMPNQWFRLTIQRADKLEAVIAQWEPSNMKWYYPEPYEGRTECGYTNEIWFTDDHNWKIVEVRPL